MKNPLTTIIITTWNSQKFLPSCLKSIFAQTAKDFSVAIIDNGSTDGTIDYVRKNYPQISVHLNLKNLGFAYANNQGIKMGNSKYIMLCNHDVILENDFLEKLVATIECNDEVASAGGKILKAQWSNNPLPKFVPTDIIDSCGIRLTRSHKMMDLGAGEKDVGQRNILKEVFGTSGALVLYRFSALQEIKYNNQWLDEDFFSYKVDVDIAWRLRLAGYKAVYNPSAVAYHFRGVDKKDNRKNRLPINNQLSYKNHLLSIVKNQTFINLIIYSPLILGYEIGKFIYLLLTEPRTLAGLSGFFRQLPSALEKRKFILKNKKIKSKEIRKWLK